MADRGQHRNPVFSIACDRAHTNPFEAGLHAVGEFWNRLPKPPLPRLPGLPQAVPKPRTAPREASSAAERPSAAPSTATPSVKPDARSVPLYQRADATYAESKAVAASSATTPAEPTDVWVDGASEPLTVLSHATQPNGGLVNKDELGRATWTFLHTLAAQFPEQPTRSQQKDVKTLVGVLTRIYPCADCAKHFKEVVRHDPPDVSSGPELQQWMCRVHNIVNRSLDKPTFNCNFVGARWGALDCGEQLACDMTVGRRH